MEENKEKFNKAIRCLDSFKDILSKMNHQTKSMCSILSNFDNRLLKLEETIQPIYKETGNLQMKQENIVKILEKINFVIKFYTVANEVEAQVTAGPGSNLKSYLEKLDRLKEAICYFEENNAESPELMNVNSLYEKGGNFIEREFRQLLSRHSNPMKPVLIYDLVHDEDNPNLEKIIQEQFPDKIREELNLMAKWLCENRNDDFITVYANIRSEVLVKSLQGLHDQQKSNSGSYQQGAFSSPAQPIRKNLMMPIRDATPQKRTPKSIQQSLKKKLQDVIPGEMLGTKLSQQNNELKDDLSIGEREIVSYLTNVSALYKLMQIELRIMNGIIPMEYQKPIFSRLVYPALEIVVSEGEGLANRVKKCVTRQDFSSALNLFPILRHQASMRHNFDLLFDGCTMEVQTKFQGLVITLQVTIGKALEEFVDFIKSDVHTKVPKDGTVHELTSNVMIFIVQLLGYLDILSRVITVSDLQSLENSNDKNRLAYAQYITRVLSALGLTLQNKSEAYTDPHLKAIFKLNNLHYILKTLRKSTLLKIVHLYNSEIEAVYEEQILECKRIYSQSWSRVLHYVLEVDKPVSQQRIMPEMNQLPNMRLKDKDRQNIKDKFSGFNKEIEEIRKIQKSYAIPDIELRDLLKKENIDYIVPKYELFYNKYWNTNFSQNPEKYIKHTPKQVEEMINSFFDSTA